MNTSPIPYGAPRKIEFCTKCVISNQRPSSSIEFKSSNTHAKQFIQFDHEGVCSACNYHDLKEKGIRWERREQILHKLCDKFRRKDGGYDVIVPGSGGKDSAFTAHILKYKYGMNPLTVTWAPHLYTSIGWENFTNWMHVGGLDNILYTPNGRIHRLLTQKAFHNLLHPFQPFILGQRIIGPSMAKRFGVNLVMYGENQAEYGNNLDDNEIPTMDYNFFSAPRDPLKLKLGGEALKEILKDKKCSISDFSPYLPFSQQELTKAAIEVHYLGYYLKWDPQECYYYAVENTGFKPNTERTQGSYSKYSSIDDKTDPFFYYTAFVKFGLGRASYDAAQEIRNDKITREEGVHLVRKYDDEFPSKYFSGLPGLCRHFRGRVF